MQAGIVLPQVKLYVGLVVSEWKQNENDVPKKANDTYLGNVEWIQIVCEFSANPVWGHS